MTRYNHGQTIKYSVRAEDISGNGILNADMKLQLYRKDDDMFFDGAVWQVARFSIPMIEKVDTVNFPGVWTYDFDTTPFNLVDEYVAEFVDVSGNAVNAPFNLIENQVGGYLDSIDVKLDTIITTTNKIVGLSHENFVLDPTDFDTTDPKEMIKGKVRIYDTPANTAIDNGVTGLVAKYDIDAPRTLGVLDKFTMVLEP